MTLGGVIVLYILVVLAKGANHFGIGPRWLRRFEIGKNTFY